MDTTLAGEIGYWVGEVAGWPCSCQGAEMFLCDRCRVDESLRAAADHVAAGNTAAAARAVRRAAQIEGRLVKLRDQLEEEVHAAPYEELHIAIGSGPAAACTAAEHAEITADAIRREAELEKIGQQHDEELGIHLQLANHRCGSTLAWHLPGHRLEVGR